METYYYRVFLNESVERCNCYDAPESIKRLLKGDVVCAIIDVHELKHVTSWIKFCNEKHGESPVEYTPVYVW